MQELRDLLIPTHSSYFNRFSEAACSANVGLSVREFLFLMVRHARKESLGMKQVGTRARNDRCNRTCGRPLVFNVSSLGMLVQARRNFRSIHDHV